MHRIKDERMGGIAMRNFRMFLELCGENSLKNVTIVTTFWSEVTPAVGAKREAQLRDNFFKPALDKGAKLLRHDDTPAGAGKIIEAIMVNHPIPLRVQVELVDENKSLLETAAGAVLNRELAEQARKHEVELQKLKDEMEQAINEHDEEFQKEIQTAEKVLEAKMQRVHMDRLKLRATNIEGKAQMTQLLRESLTHPRVNKLNGQRDVVQEDSQQIPEEGTEKELAMQIKELKAIMKNLKELHADMQKPTERDAVQKKLADLLIREAEQRNRSIWEHAQQFINPFRTVWSRFYDSPAS